MTGWNFLSKPDLLNCPWINSFFFLEPIFKNKKTKTASHVVLTRNLRNLASDRYFVAWPEMLIAKHPNIKTMYFVFVNFSPVGYFSLVYLAPAL